jgi:uncharacterized protein
MNASLVERDRPALLPTGEGARLGLIDALRGAALFGVLLVNMLWFAGFDNFLNQQQVDALTSPMLDSLSASAIDLFIYAKSIGIFTFLFGVGFWMQMRSLEERDSILAGRIYIRRMLGLMVLGVIHWMLWSGDILHVYAIGGLILFSIRRWRIRTMVVVGLCLAVAARPLFGRFLELLSTGTIAGLDSVEVDLANRFSTFAYGGVWAVLAIQFREDLLPNIVTGGIVAATLHALGRFMVGVAVARGGYLRNVRVHWKAFSLVAVAGLIVGQVAQRDWVLRDLLAAHGLVESRELLGMIGHLSNSIGVTALTAAYVAAFCLAWQWAVPRRLLELFVPLGRMALTNYLTYTPVSYFLFCGFGLGLMGSAGPAFCLKLSVLIFGVQMIGSHLWLKFFRMGPAEWLWRWWTYGTRPQLRRA